MNTRPLNGWAVRILATQVAVAIALVAACAEDPVGMEGDRFSAEHENQFAAVIGVASEPASSADVAAFGEPPSHGQHSYYHVWNSQYGKEEDIHRLATQWYNQDKKRWGFHRPDSRWFFLSGLSAEPAESDAIVN